TGCGHKMERQCIEGRAVIPKHRTVYTRLRRRNGCIAVAHESARDKPALNHNFRFNAEECRFPEHEIREFAYIHGADETADAMCDCGIDGVFRDVTFHPEIVIVGTVL